MPHSRPPLHLPARLERPTRPALALLATLAPACVSEPSGDEVGTYQVTMSLESNTCGAGAVNLKDGHRYTAQLRADGEEGFWRIPGQMALPGSYTDGQFKFSYGSVVARSAPDAGAFCQLVQDEVLEGAVAEKASASSDDGGPLDAGIAKSTGSTDDDSKDDDDEDADFERPAEGLVGRHVFSIKAAAGTDCSDALSPRGPFERLPCTVAYDLKGTDTKSF